MPKLDSIKPLDRIDLQKINGSEEHVKRYLEDVSRKIRTVENSTGPIT